MHDLSWQERLWKICLIMKFLVLILFVSTLQLSASVYSQEARVTVHLENASFEDVVKVLENATDFTFLYRDHQVGRIKNLNLQYTDVDIKEVLNACLKGSGLTYRLVDNTIVIQPVPMSSGDTLSKITMKGIVKDVKGEVLPGVTIRVKGTTMGFVTNVKGEFDFDLPKRDNLVLIFSFVGYKRQEVAVKDTKKTLSVVLEEELQAVEEVVVTGIFNKPKESFTGAVTAVTKEELRANFSRNLLQTLSNLEPSLRILQNNEAGSNPNVLPELQLRGSSTLSSVSDLQQESRAELNTPLFILDGFEISLERVMDLNQNEVESITVLKDAGATALYGSRGANGVIVITSTRPAAGKLRVSYRGDVKVEIPDLSSYNVASAAEKLQLEKDYGIWDDARLQDAYQELKEKVDRGENYDWIDIPVRTGIGQRHMLGFTGGSDEWRIRFDLSYDATIGAMKGSDRKNLNGTLAVDYTQDKWFITQSFSIGTNNSANSPYGSFDQYVQMNRYWSPYDENGKPIDYYDHPLGSSVRNPLYDKSVGCWNKSKYTVLRSNTSFRYEILPGFRITSSFGITRKMDTKDLFKVPSHRDFYGYETSQKGRYTRQELTEDSWQVRAGVNYTNTFNDKHMLTVNFSAEIAEQKREQVSWAATGFINDDMDHLGTSIGYPSRGGTSGSDFASRRISINSSVNYYYDLRYFLDVTYSMNGASSFGKDSRWGGFYSLGAGWTISNESFIKDHWGFINNLKLRYSYGVSGNMGFSPSDAMTTYFLDVQQTYLSEFGAQISKFANPNLKWQNTYQHNLGLDAGLFNNRLSFGFNYFHKITNNTVTDIMLPISHGFETFKGNVGKIKNIGYDLSISTYLIREHAERKMNWSITGKFYRLKNTIVELSPGLKETVKNLIKTMSTAVTYYRYIEGHSMDAIYGLRTLGVDPLSGDRLFLTKDGQITFQQDPDDMVYLGDRQPKVSGNISTAFSYKGFSLNIGFDVKWGGKAENFTELKKGENLYLLYNVDRRVLTHAWRKPGDQAMYQRYSTGTSRRSTFPCDMFVHKDNVFRCSNINIGYTFPREFVKKYLGMEMLSINAYLSDVFYLSSIERERGTSYPFSINPNFSISCSF